MKFTKNYLFIFISLILVGCAPSTENIKMVPHVDYSIFTSSTRTVTIRGVTGGGEETLGMAKIKNESFQEALLETLKRSHLFKGVYLNKAADDELHTEIVSQKVQPGLSAYAALFVHYTLISTKTNKIIWSENIFSQNNAFGANQGKDVLESVARDNLAQLLKRLSSVLRK
jgi:hypothetical protein